MGGLIIEFMSVGKTQTFWPSRQEMDDSQCAGVRGGGGGSTTTGERIVRLVTGDQSGNVGQL